MSRPPLTRIPADVVALADYERLAPEFIDAAAWAYLAGGAGDERTLRRNREAFDRWWIEPRVLQDFSGADTRLSLGGRELTHPILVAPMASQRLFHPEGEKAVALGAAAMQAGLVLSCQSSVAVEELARHPAAPLWAQLYLQGDRSFTEKLVRRFEAAGCEALVVTVDAPVNGVRNREQRAGFQLPADIEAVHLAGAKPLPAVDSPFDPAYLATVATWEEIVWLKSITRLPVWVKGILSSWDANLAMAYGAAGLIVSNHGGRTLDGLPAAIEALPPIARLVQGRVPLVVDGGIRRGTDIFTALALGADAVMVGRPVLHGLAVAGATGVAHVLKILRTELEIAMMLAGRPTLTEIWSEALWG